MTTASRLSPKSVVSVRLANLGARNGYGKNGLQCPTAVPVHFEQDSLSTPLRPESTRDRRPPAQQRP
eukprot:9392301-Pyramimonas_sp.AAC.1